MALVMKVSELAASLRGEREELSATLNLWAYNAVDCCVTSALAERLDEQLSRRPEAAASYSFVRAMQGPALEMMTRGVAIQPHVRESAKRELERAREAAQARLDALANLVWGPEEVEEGYWEREVVERVGKRGQALKPKTRRVRKTRVVERPLGLNPGSPPQMLAFFNIALGMPERMGLRKTRGGVIRSPTCDAKALKAWRGQKTKGPGRTGRDRSVPWVQLAAPFVDLVLEIREATKLLGTLASGVDADGRMRCSYGVASTETARWSSRKSAFGSGTNLQNITPRLRRMFAADDGWRFANRDLEQAESRVVGALAWAATGEDAYWRACETGDLHTTVARLTWPELEWSRGNDFSYDRSVADRPYPDYPRFSYRDMSKRLGHGSNYRGSSVGISAATGVPSSIVSAFQERYFSAFPELGDWHQRQISDLQSRGYLDTPLGRRRFFFGRLDDDATLREAIAHVPQSTIGELLNEGMRRVWLASLSGDLPIQLLLQNHDAFAFQTPESAELGRVLDAVGALMLVPVPLSRGVERRSLLVPSDCAVGWNWGYYDPASNPDGLRKWKGADARTRQTPAKPSLDEWFSAR